MPEEDKFPILGICVGCGTEIKYSPVRMPLSRPVLNPEKPGHYAIEYAPMCLACILDQLTALKQKVELGEMYPTQTWDTKEGDDSGSLHIVPLIPEPQPKEVPPEKVGWFKRIIRFIW
jgi:hypothetical protein